MQRRPGRQPYLAWSRHWLALLLVLGCRDSGTLVGSPEAFVEAPAAVAPAAPAPAAGVAAVAAVGSPSEAAPAAGAGEATPQYRLSAGGAGNASGRFGLVVSVELEATQVGVRVLEMGGNAVDAAVATAYALAVTHPNAGNLGGGGFMLIARRGEPVVAIDFRERAPDAINARAFARMLSGGAKGPSASGVPGTVAGLNLAEQRYGRLPLDQVVLPAVELARRGHRIGRRQARALEQAWPELRRDPAARAIFGSRSGPLAEGDALVQKDLADTLERIAHEGDAGFYAGPTAEKLVRAMGDDGLIRLPDLLAYRAVQRDPLRLVYRGLDVTTMPPPSSGGLAVVQTLALLEQLGVERWPRGSADELHLFLEASKRVQARRRYELVDPDADPSGMSAAALARRLTPEGLATLTPEIDPTQATASAVVYPMARRLPPEPPQTTHLSVVDALGNAVSCTVTLSTSYGARYVAPGTGVVMNNSLAGFGSTGLNLPRPGRRMLSSMSPTLVSQQGQVIAVLGSPGGDTIPSTVVQVLRNLVDHRLTVDQAIEAPRVHHGFSPDEVRVELERPLDPLVVEALEARGHRVVEEESPIGDANNIVIVGGVAYGHADSREGGLALGPSRLPPAMQLPETAP